MSEFLTIGEPISLFASEDADMSLAQATEFHKYLAGAEVNVAVGVSRLGHDAEYLTRLGQDPFGEFITEQLHENNIGTEHIETTPDYWTAFQLKQRVTHGDPGIFYFRKGSAAAHFLKSTLDKVDFAHIKLVHLSGIFPAISEQAKDAFQYLIDLVNRYHITTTFDPNLRPQLWNSQDEMITTINGFAAQAQIILPGINEGEILMGSRDPEKIADFYLNQSEVTHTVVVKTGEDGAYVKTKDGNSYSVAGFHAAEVVDTVGAGDGFAVGLITGILEGLPFKDAVSRANAVGCLAVQAPGDNDGYPTPEQLKAFMAKQ